jgi:murein DD-endopeptidase MepM/ murein hydrolase activator NlpD
MPKNRYYYYDHEACAFVEVRPKRTRLYVQGATVLMLALLLAGAFTWGVDEMTVTPQELALKAENEALQQQLGRVGKRMKEFSTQLDQLAQSDQELYRTLFQIEPISEDVRKVGVGGSDPYERYSRFSTGTATLLRQTSQTLGTLERQISLQNGSYRELARLAKERSAQLDQMPAILPADGRVVSGFGIRRHPILRVHKQHAGIDVVVRVGSTVVAAADGVVKTAEFSATFGNYVEVSHPKSGYTTLYAHLSQIPGSIRPGRAVKRGEQIGLSGSTGRSTGPHVHYEVHDAKGNPVNPILFFAPSMTPHAYKKLLQEAEQSSIALD